MARLVGEESGLALAAVVEEEWDGQVKGGGVGMTPHLFRAAPEDTVNFVFLAMA